MIIFLLLVIIAIMLFGAKAVKSAAGAVMLVVCAAITAIAFFAMGWIGLVAMIVIAALAFAFQQQKAEQHYADQNARIERRIAANQSATSSNTAEARRLMERNRQLDAEFRAKIGKPD